MQAEQPSRTPQWSGRPTAQASWSFLVLMAVGRRSPGALDARFLPLCKELGYTHRDRFISLEELSRCIQPPNPWALIG
jgi:hypothetical protein